MLSIRQGVSILAALLLGGCGREPGHEPADERDRAIHIDASNCRSMCQSFYASIKPDGTTYLGVFRSSHDGQHWFVKYDAAYRPNLGPAAYKKLHDAIEELKVADLEQRLSNHAMPCADNRRPQLKITSETQLPHYYVLHLSCPQHHDIALQLGKIAMGFSDGVVQLDEWPRDVTQER